MTSVRKCKQEVPETGKIFCLTMISYGFLSNTKDSNCICSFYLSDKLQNTTIEERVSLLELQVANLDEDVDFLFDEQVIQDERLFSLEQTDNQVVVELDEDQCRQVQGIKLQICQDYIFCF